MEMLILITILCIFTFVFALIRIDYKVNKIVNEMEKIQKEDVELIKVMLEELNKKTFKPPFDIKTSPRPTPVPFDPFGQTCLYACPTTPFDPNITTITTDTINVKEE